MNIPQNIKSFSPIEIIGLVAFVLYLVIPIETPQSLAMIVNSPLGILSIFAITISLFLYSNPILAIVYIFVGYELLRRSSGIPDIIDSSPKVIHTNSNNDRVTEIVVPLFRDEKQNIIDSPTLEENVIQKMAPISGKPPAVSSVISTSFKPISENVKGASLL
jgi:hypothetical protein